MSTKASKPFWLDGGYDRESVEACHYHPAHNWITLRLGDVLENPSDPDERMVICSGCFAPRCGYSTEADPCILPRHHRELHLTASGELEDATTWPGTEKPLPPPELLFDLGPSPEEKGKR